MRTKTIPYLTAFISGFVVLSLEILGFRVLAPYFGYSIYVFGTLIGLILLALAVGYWVGGLLSRRKIKTAAFGSILLCASIYITIASISYEMLVSALSEYNIITGVFLSTLILWAFPMIVLATVSPYLVGLESVKDDPGNVAGKISALGTIGGLIGTFLTSFYLLPVFGTQATFIFNAYATTAMTILWFVARRKIWILLLLVVPVTAQILPTAKLPTNLVHAEESAYSFLEVIDQGNILALRTNKRGNTVYSAVMKDGSLPPFLLYNLFAVPSDARESRTGLLLGVGAGTLAQVHKTLNPDLKLTGIEIDPKIIDIGNDFFELDEFTNLEKIIISDARPFLMREPDTYDVIEMDIFKENEIPFYLVSREFFELTKMRLNDKGMLMMNIYDPSANQIVQKNISNTIAAVYDYTYVVPAGLGSFFVVATETPLVIPPIQESDDSRLNSLKKYFLEHGRQVKYSDEEIVFTDDLAPIETLYNQGL